MPPEQNNNYNAGFNSNTSDTMSQVTNFATKNFATKKSFNQRLSDTGALLRSTFDIMWLGGYELKRPVMRTAIYAGVTTLFFWIFVSTVAISTVSNGPSYVFQIGLPSLLIWIVLKFYSMFYFTRAKADQALLVNSHLKGIPMLYSKAHEMNNEESWKIRGIVFIDILIKGANASANSGGANTQGGGIKQFILSIFFFALNEVWDLVSNYLLPAIVIEKKSVKEIVPSLKLVKNNIPGTLVGVFGIDFAGAVIGSLFSFIYLFSILIFQVVF